MSIISGIFPSEIVDIDESGLPIYDRAVDEEYFAKYHSEFLSNGVYANPSNNFQVMVNDLMKLKVKAGSCFINGYYAYDNFDGEIILEPASSDLNRIDRIVTRLDRINRKISIEVKKGAYGTVSYSAPSLQRDDDIWELGLADVLVKKGTTQIVQANITDLRPIQEYCGYVYNPMQNIDTTDLFAQYDNSFEVWFQHVKDQLSTDAAGNLQKQIDTHTSELEDFMSFFNNGGRVSGKVSTNGITVKQDDGNAIVLSTGVDGKFKIQKYLANGSWDYDIMMEKDGYIEVGKDLYMGNYSRKTNGYTKISNGMILQWGTSNLLATNYSSNGASFKTGVGYFPIAFPNTCLNVVAVSGFREYTLSIANTGKTQFNAEGCCVANGPSDSTRSFHWIAIGY
ncbi:gp53-like domain-containing protein [uncultured Clostridium sp.]|uniref:gp53-like domain-containing protein n=1 Tax=uncultured Clostridium sp. TaxID=59620 RepID=UPI0032180DD9